MNKKVYRNKIYSLLNKKIIRHKPSGVYFIAHSDFIREGKKVRYVTEMVRDIKKYRSHDVLEEKDIEELN